MPTEALALALAASIYPPALAAVIALGRGDQVRVRIVMFVIAAFVTVMATGSLMLYMFGDLKVSRESVASPAASLYVAAGIALLVVALRIHRRPPKPHEIEREAGRIERYLGSTRLVALLGVVLYILPSPIYVGAVKSVADSTTSATTEFVYLFIVVAVMLWLIELPMIMLIARPEQATARLEQINSWFSMHSRQLIIAVLVLAGGYLTVIGLLEIH